MWLERSGEGWKGGLVQQWNDMIWFASFLWLLCETYIMGVGVGVGTKAEGKNRLVGGCGRVCEGGWWSRLEFNQRREWEAGRVKNMFYWGGDMSNITVSVRSAESRL